ncbi:MAG: M20/M25/M40 family metallo-hydrolase [Gemmatimonadaceae bacterium]
MKRLPLALLILAACSRPVAVTTGAAAPLSAEERTRQLLFTLADDSMEGRGVGTRGSARAARYIAEQMQAAGLTPAGDSGYFQRVPIAMVARGSQETLRPTLMPSFTAMDTIPTARRLNGVNVAGIIRGSDAALASEAILVDAHYDHVGIRAPVNGDSIYNGADDDASGTVAVLEIARAIAAGPRPKRTIVFVATTGEETGLLGTRWYISHPVVPLEQTVANLEIEMIGRPDSLAGGAGRGWLTGYERSTMGEMFAAAGLPIVADKRLDQQFFMRSDNIAFARRGIVAHTLSSFNMHTDYHQPSDEASKADVAHMTRLIDAAARAVRLLADGTKPVWKEGGRPQ